MEYPFYMINQKDFVLEKLIVTTNEEVDNTFFELKYEDKINRLVLKTNWITNYYVGKFDSVSIYDEGLVNIAKMIDSFMIDEIAKSKRKVKYYPLIRTYEKDGKNNTCFNASTKWTTDEIKNKKQIRMIILVETKCYVKKNKQRVRTYFNVERIQMKDKEREKVEYCFSD